MTASPQTFPSRRAGVAAVHSVNRFVFSVPDLDEAEKFYSTFGLDPRRTDDRIDLYAHGHPHCWASIHIGTPVKTLQYISYGIFAEDLDARRARIDRNGAACAAHALSDGSGLWLRDPDGTPLQLIVAPKVSPSAKTVLAVALAVAAGKGAAPARSRAAQVRPRHLSHILKFTPDVARMMRFAIDVLGLRLSDHSGDGIAFMHGAHGSDHHLVAFAKSNGPGLHHSSWDVGSINEVGRGSEQMREAGYDKGWGVGRHVLGSNYFYYVRDPWGSWAEYSCDIDFVPATLDWPAADNPPEDSFYLWGPPVPLDFITNQEVAAPA